MKEKLLWLGAGILVVAAMVFSGLNQRGRLSGHYRMVGGPVDTLVRDGVRLMNGTMEIHFNPSRNVHTIQLEKVETQQEGYNFMVPLTDECRQSYTTGSVVRIPWSGHYDTKSPPVVLLTAKVNGRLQQVRMGIRK